MMARYVPSASGLPDIPFRALSAGLAFLTVCRASLPPEPNEMRRQPTLLLALVALLATPGLEGLAQAPPRLSGAWTLDPEQSDDINAEINRSIAHMNVVVRQVARPRLRSTNVPYPQLIFSIGENVSVDMPGHPSVSSPANGDPVLWHRKTGRPCTQKRGSCVEVTTTWEDEGLVQTFRSEDAQRRNIFTLSPDGMRLTMVATMSSPRLPTPLVYRLVYARRS
jgi:hypothetical protein